MTFGVLRAALALAMVLALADSRSCGFTPDEGKDEGEPCTRTSECRSSLECRGGVCMTESTDLDASVPRFDASPPRDAAQPFDGTASDGSASDGSASDGSASDGSASDASASDGSASEHTDASDASP